MKCDKLKAIDDLYERKIRNGSDPYKIHLVHVLHQPVYLKNDVDAAIAELKAENQNLKDTLGGTYIAYKQCYDEYKQCDKELRHNKYKRCLAMAKLCEKRSEIYFTWSKKMDFILKWKLRWLAMAEKFKEAK